MAHDLLEELHSLALNRLYRFRKAFLLEAIADETGKMMDHSAGNVGNDEAHRYIDLLNEKQGGMGITFYPGVSYRNLMIIEGSFDVVTTPPHDILEPDAPGRQRRRHGDGYLPPVCRIGEVGTGFEPGSEILNQAAPVVDTGQQMNGMSIPRRQVETPGTGPAEEISQDESGHVAVA